MQGSRALSKWPHPAAVVAFLVNVIVRFVRAGVQVFFFFPTNIPCRRVFCVRYENISILGCLFYSIQVFLTLSLSLFLPALVLQLAMKRYSRHVDFFKVLEFFLTF